MGKKLKILLAGNVFRKVGKEYTRSSTSKEIYKCSRQPIFHFSLSSPSLYLIDPKNYIILIQRKAAISRKIHYGTLSSKKRMKKNKGFRILWKRVVCWLHMHPHSGKNAFCENIIMKKTTCFPFPKGKVWKTGNGSVEARKIWTQILLLFFYASNKIERLEKQGWKTASHK